MKLGKQIKIGAFLSYITIALNILMGLIYTPWMIHTIGKSDYGIYGMGTSIISILALDFGVGSAVIRYIAKYQEEHKEDKVREVVGWALKLYLFIDLIIAILAGIVFFSLSNIYASLTISEINKLQIVFIIIGTHTIFSFPFQVLNGVIIARERFVFQKTMEFLSKILTVAFTGILLFFGKGLYALVLVSVVVDCIAMIIKLVYLKREKLVAVTWKTEDMKLKQEFISFSAWTVIILIAQRLTLNIIPSILGAVSGTAQVAIFSPALSIEGYVFNLTGALASLFLTKVTRLYEEDGKGKAVENLAVHIGQIQLFLIGIIFSVFASVGKEFIHLWLGDEYKDTYYVTLLLIIPFLITSTQVIMSIALSVTGQLKYKTLSNIVTAAVTFILSLLLSERLGAVGSGIGYFIGYVLGEVVVANFVYAKKLEINIWRFFKNCHVKMLIPISTTFLIGLLLQDSCMDTGWFLFAVKCIILVCIYMILTWTFALSEDNKNMIKELLQKK